MFVLEVVDVPNHKLYLGIRLQSPADHFYSCMLPLLDRLHLLLLFKIEWQQATCRKWRIRLEEWSALVALDYCVSHLHIWSIVSVSALPFCSPLLSPTPLPYIVLHNLRQGHVRFPTVRKKEWMIRRNCSEEMYIWIVRRIIMSKTECQNELKSSFELNRMENWMELLWQFYPQLNWIELYNIIPESHFVLCDLM